MAVVVCPKCGLKVTDDLGECFACGAPLPRRRLEEPERQEIVQQEIRPVEQPKPPVPQETIPQPTPKPEIVSVQQAPVTQPVNTPPAPPVTPSVVVARPDPVKKVPGFFAWILALLPVIIGVCALAINESDSSMPYIFLYLLSFLFILIDWIITRRETGMSPGWVALSMFIGIVSPFYLYFRAKNLNEKKNKTVIWIVSFVASWILVGAAVVQSTSPGLQTTASTPVEEPVAIEETEPVIMESEEPSVTEEPSLTPTSTEPVVEEASLPPEPDYRVTATDVYQELQENQVACKTKYDGKLVELSGIINDIGTNVVGQEYISLETGDSLSFDHVLAYFRNAEMESVAGLNKGMYVTVIGTCSIGSMSFKLGECVVTEAREAAEEDAAEQSTATPLDIPVYDANGIIINAVEFNPSGEFSGPSIKLYIENNSDIPISVREKETSVNGYVLTGYLIADVPAGKKANEKLSFSSTGLEDNGITDITEIEFVLEVTDDNYNTIGTTDTITVQLN